MSFLPVPAQSSSLLPGSSPPHSSHLASLYLPLGNRGIHLTLSRLLPTINWVQVLKLLTQWTVTEENSKQSFHPLLSDQRVSKDLKCPRALLGWESSVLLDALRWLKNCGWPLWGRDRLHAVTLSTQRARMVRVLEVDGQLPLQEDCPQQPLLEWSSM